MQKKAVFALALAIGFVVGANKAALAQEVKDSTSRSNSTSSTTAQANSMGAGRESRGGMKPGGSTGKDLAISAAKSVDHTVLFRAMRVSGLSEQAAGKGPYTVFAPTNEAFDKLPAGTLDALLAPAAKSKLVKLLSYHVVKGNLTSDQLQDGQKLKTVTGGTLTVGKQGDAITITDGQGNTANINRADLEATNGTIHSIDAVLMPAEKK